MAATTVALIVFLYAFAGPAILATAAELERDYARRDVKRALNAVDLELGKLASMTRDYAAWDDTYEFVIDRNERYLETNLVDATFINLRLNMILIFDTSGRSVFKKGFDLQRVEETPIDPEVLENFSTGSPFIRHLNESSVVTGLIVAGRAPILIASSPILTSEYVGPIRGSFVMGRYLNQDEVRTLGETLDLALSIDYIEDPELPQDVQKAKQALLQGQDIVVTALDEDEAAGYALMSDVYGMPALVLRIAFTREFYREAQKSYSYFIYTIIAAAVAFSAATTLLIERSVILPIARLADAVKRIGEGGSSAARVSAEGGDEVSNLGRDINRMLTLLESRQQDLLAERNRLEQVTGSVGAGLAVVSRDLRVLWANSIWKGILGGVEGRVCGEELTGRSGACSRCGVREIFDKGLDNVRYEQAMKDADGNEAWFEVITTPIKDKRGAAVEAIELFVPITDRKRLEEELKLKTEHLEELVEERTKELRQSEARYRAVVEDQTEMICRFRPDWTLTFVNEAYSRFVGLKAEELIGKSFEPFILKEDLEKIRGLIMTLTPQNPTVTYEERVLMPDGKVRWQEWVDRAIFNENNEIVEIQGVGRDITERKELEDRLRAAERLAAIGETASMVGHDLRNPLQVMMNTTYLAGEYLESILKHADPQVSKEVKGLCSTMQEQIDYMNKIVSDLQDFAKPLTPQLSEIDLQQLARETVSTVKRPENVEVLFDIQEGLGRVRADAAMMKRALTNLITNAIQSMPNGGSLTISVRRERDGAVIGIADTGVGISEENLSRLFQPFFTTKAKGQGLGLAVTKRIVEAHGGEIKVKSRVGVGTLFTIKIPIGGA